MSEPKAWVVRPFPDDVDSYQRFLDEDFAGLGWPTVPDLQDQNLANRDDVKQLVLNTYPGLESGTLGQWTGMIYRFWNEMSVQDLVLVPYYGVVSVGEVVGGYEYVTADPHVRHRRKIRWIEKDLSRTNASETLFTAMKGRLTQYEAGVDPQFISNVIAGKLLLRIEDETNRTSVHFVKSLIKSIASGTQPGIHQNSFEKEIVPELIQNGIAVERMSTRNTKGDGDTDLIVRVLPFLDLYVQVKYWDKINSDSLAHAKRQVRLAVQQAQLDDPLSQMLPCVIASGQLEDGLEAGWHSDESELPVLVLTVDTMESWVSQWIQGMNSTRLFSLFPNLKLSS